jgi:hypothetical protein
MAAFRPGPPAIDLPGCVEPPVWYATAKASWQLTAEHFAFSDEAGRMGPRGVTQIAPALVNNPFWDFWWD